MQTNLLQYFERDPADPARLVLTQDVELCVENTQRDVFHIPNTAALSQTKDFTKRVGLYAEELEGVVLDGCGHTVTACGRMIYLMLKRCRQVTLRNLTFRYLRPTVSEFCVRSVKGRHALVEIDPHSHYRIVNGTLQFVDEEGLRYEAPGCYPVSQIHLPHIGETRRMNKALRFNLGYFRSPKAIEREPNLVELIYAGRAPLTQGATYQMRDTLRDEVGFYFSESADIRMEACTVHDMHGLGVVSAFCRDLQVTECKFVPAPGRTTVGFADLIHCVCCQGEIVVEHNVFDGAHDDCINVHGLHLKVVGRAGDRQVLVQFGHPETFGFPCFEGGDTVRFVDAATLLDVATGVVARADAEGESHIRLTLQDPIRLPEGKLVVENADKNRANLTFAHNTVRNIPTRGVLYTGGGTARITDNLFVRTGMSAILISDDANSWFESGHVERAEITGNRFLGCATPVIWVDPQVKRVAGPVHGDIVIQQNHFEQKGTSISVRACKHVEEVGNTFADPEHALQTRD